MTEQRSAMVEEKVTPSRLIFYIENTARLLKQWLAIRPENSVTVFCSFGTNTRGKPMTYEGLYRMLERLKRKAGIKTRVNPHGFRHSFAREYIRNCGDLATSARLIRHSDVTITVSYYAVFSADGLAQSHDKSSLLKGIDWKSESDE